MLVRFPLEGSAAEAYDTLKAEGIMARPMSAYGLADCLRFTIGTEDEMAETAGALEAFMAGRRPL